MAPITESLTFTGEVLRRGFWLYVWEITPPGGSPIYYVGRTGDSSTQFAQSPFNRMGQHLGFNVKSNVLRRRLGALGFAPEECQFHLVVHGPLLAEALSMELHRASRDVVAGLEKALAESMAAAGYEVINPVYSKKPLDAGLFRTVRHAFAEHFPRLMARGLES